MQRFLSKSYTPLSSYCLSCFRYIHDPPFTPIPKSPAANHPQKRPLVRSTPSDKSSPTTLPLHSDLPFDFRYSYSEINPSVKPIGFREPPRFSPFGPGRLDREWDGVSAPLKTESLEVEQENALEDPLTQEEVEELVEKYRHSDCGRQINIGRDGVTHNMLDDIHNHWKRSEAVRIKCLGIPTLDMENVCYHLEDKTGGKVIHRQINIILLYRGRNYDPKRRPTIPLMLWKPRAAIYPRLVKKIADGLTSEETKELRHKGMSASPLMKLTRNGVYVNVAARIREAFKDEEVVKLDCSHIDLSDCKRIGVKLRDLVPCVPLFFKKDQIVLWRGKYFQSDDQTFVGSVSGRNLP